MKIREKIPVFYESLALFCVTFLIFICAQQGREVIGFESRFYWFAQEMWRVGASWFPLSYGEPYPDYLSTSTILIYLVSKIFGEFNRAIAVVPSAFAGSITVVMTYLIGAEHSKRWGICAVFFLFLTAIFLKSARAITLDIFPTAITVCCFYFIYSADHEHKPNKSKWIYAFLILGFLFRGPIGLVIPAGVICSYYLLENKFKKLFCVGTIAFVLLLMGIFGLVLIAQHVGGKSFLHEVLRMQIFGRLDEGSRPFHFYFSSSFKNYALSFPIAFLVLLFASFYSRKNFKELRVFLGWVLVILVGMSLPGDKKIRYILPMVPALTLIAAYPFAQIDSKQFFILRRVLAYLFLCFPAIFIVLLHFIFSYAQSHQIHFVIPYFQLNFFFVCLQMLSLWNFYRSKSSTTVEMRNIFLATFAFVMVYIFAIEPMTFYLDKARAFVISTEQQRHHQNAGLVFYKEKPDGIVIKYLINMPKVERPLFVSNENELQSFSRHHFFITKTADFKQIRDDIKSHLMIVAQDRLGHTPMTVFKINDAFNASNRIPS